MARPGISPEQILQTIQQLESTGIEATVTAIRDRLGTGSFTTISQVLQSWRHERARISRPPVPELPDSVAGLFRQLWAESWRAADAIGAIEREAAAQDRAAHEAEAQDMQNEIGRLERERQKVGGRAVEQREIGLTMPRFIRSQNPIYGRLAKADLDSDGSSGSALRG